MMGRMTKPTPQKGSGRPRAEKPKSHLISFRLDDATYAAVKRLQQKWGIETFSPSDTSREALYRVLKREGLTDGGQAK